MSSSEGRVEEARRDLDFEIASGPAWGAIPVDAIEKLVEAVRQEERTRFESLLWRSEPSGIDVCVACNARTAVRHWHYTDCVSFEANDVIAFKEEEEVPKYQRTTRGNELNGARDLHLLELVRGRR